LWVDVVGMKRVDVGEREVQLDIGVRTWLDIVKWVGEKKAWFGVEMEWADVAGKEVWSDVEME